MTWVFIDVSYLAYRALHSVGHLELDDIPTGVMFGFFQQLKSICQDPRINSNKMILFFDSKRSRRKKAYEPYKKKRHSKRSDEELQVISKLWDQVVVLRKLVLPAMGFQCKLQAGMEADDLIAYAAQQIPYGEKGVIVGADQDLYQCMSQRCAWFNPSKRLYYTPSSFEAHYGIHPSRWGEVKSIAGCKSDCVAGVVGVGEKTAVKYLLGTLPHHYETYKAITSAEGIAIRQRNWPLVVLPHCRTRHFELKAPVYNADAFFEYCERYGLHSFLKKKQAWKRFLLGTKALKLRKRKA